MRQEDLTVMEVGGGAREHVHCHSFAKSPLVKRWFCTPGNGGIPFENRRNVKDTDIHGLVQLALAEKVDLVNVGPEGPLVAGLVDEMHKVGIRAFGPTAAAARLEGSKIYGKTVCDMVNAPTADWLWTDDYAEACAFINAWDSVPVIKADGLCGGKGVVVPDTKREAMHAAHDMLITKKFGTAGSRIVIEDRLSGPECSVMAICSDLGAHLLRPARDFKRLLSGDKGPNTGGMGAYSPLPDVDDAMLEYVKSRIILPILRHMSERGTPYHGLLYVGLMLTANGPYVLEFNVRFGDPETQVVFPCVASDIVEYMLATFEPGALAKLPPLRISNLAAVGTVLASDGYPDSGKMKTGFPITGLERASQSALIFHAGTLQTGNELLTSGGRVMTCVGMGKTIAIARGRSLEAAAAAQFANKIYRPDIAANV